MSTITLDDEGTFRSSLDKVRGAAGTAYALCGHMTFTDPSHVHLVRQGSPPDASIEDLATHLDDGQFMYALMKLQEGGKDHLVYVHWVGERTLASKRARFGAVHDAIRSEFGEAETDIYIDKRENFTIDFFKGKLGL